MKQTQLKDALRNIKKKSVSWLSVVIVTMMSVGVFLGITFFQTSVEKSGENYFDAHAFKDIEIISSLGVTQEDIKEILAVEGVLDCEGFHLVSDSSLEFSGKVQAVDIVSMTERVSVPELLEGVMPQAENECALGSDLMETYDIHLGDTVRLAAGAASPFGFLKAAEFTVTASVGQPDYYRRYDNFYVLLPVSAFNADAMQGYWLRAAVRVSVPDNIDIYTDAYYEAVSPAESRINSVLAGRSAVRREALLEQAKQLIESGRARLTEALSQAETALTLLEQADSVIRTAAALSGHQDGYDSYQTLKETARTAYEPVVAAMLSGEDTAEAEAAAREQISQAVDQALKERAPMMAMLENIRLSDALSMVERFAGDMTVGELLDKLEGMIGGDSAIIKQLKKLTGEMTLSALMESLKNGADLFGIGKITLGSLIELGAEPLKTLMGKLGQALAAEPAARSALAELDARAEHLEESIPAVSYIVQNRRANSGFVVLRTSLNSIRACAIGFISMFLLVGALVCFSTIAIIVDEQRKLVGATKSFGFFNREILGKYMVFSLSAVLCGDILGLGLSLVMEHIFSGTLSNTYLSGRLPLYFAALPAVLICLAELAIAAIATAVACSSLLKLPAVLLMSGAAQQKERKRKEKKQKGSLYSRLILRNMRTEIVRVIISIIIIGGSCAMIGTGLSIRYGFLGMLSAETEEVTVYDAKITWDSRVSAEDQAKIEEILKENDMHYLPATESGTIYRTGNIQEATYLFTAPGDHLGLYYQLTDPKTGQTLTLPEEGVLIQSRLAEKTGLKAGDTITLYNASLQPQTVTVAGIYKNYVGRTMILSQNYYTELMGREPAVTCYLVDSAESSRLSEQIAARGLTGVTVETNDSMSKKFEDRLAVCDMVVYVLTFMAIFMSFFILTNLANIFVSRKKKELVVMRVNGFSEKQTIGYLLREMLMTTGIGLVLAVLIGWAASSIMIRQIEGPDMMFVRGFSVKAWIIAVALEAAFAALINALAFRKAKKLKLTDAAA